MRCVFGIRTLGASRRLAGELREDAVHGVASAELRAVVAAGRKGARELCEGEREIETVRAHVNSLRVYCVLGMHGT